MKNLSEYIVEQLEQIDEGLFTMYYKYNKKKPQYNYTLVSHGHAAERDQERGVTTPEVNQLFRSVWSKFKQWIESGHILMNKKDSNKSGASVAIHSYEKTSRGYLTIIAFPTKYHKEAKYYDIELVTTWKGKTIDSYKEKDVNGKTMYHPEKGQLDMWEDFAIDHFDKKDVMKV